MREPDRHAGTPTDNPPAKSKRRIAVVGAGIAGLSCAWLLAQRYDVTLYEQCDRPGGHACTVDVPGPAASVAVDTGFIVYNERTYPNFTALLSHLDVATTASDMSFGVSLDDGRLEYSGTGLSGLFAQKSNLLRPRFWRMLADLVRLYRTAPASLAMLEAERGRSEPLTTLGAWLAANRFGDALVQDHLLPMAGAIWSCGNGSVLDHPAAAFIRFCHNHGLLQLADRPRWRSVGNGSRTYVDRLTAQFLSRPNARLLTGEGVRGVWREADGVRVQGMSDSSKMFDAIVLATHAPQALALLQDADAGERADLSAFRTTHNVAVLHTDETLMPRRRGAWSSWNHLGSASASGAPCVTYWMNRLQQLGDAPDLFVTLNPARPPRAGTLLQSASWQHPIFDAAALRAQDRVWSRQGARNTWFCGAWLGDGFHEDGLQAGLAVAEAAGDVRRPWRVENESARMPAARLVRRSGSVQDAHA